VSFINLKNIACIVDFREESRQALSVAGILAIHSTAEIHVIHIEEHIAAFAGFMLAGVPTYHNIFFDYTNDETYQRALQNIVQSVVPKNISTVIHLLSCANVKNIVAVLQESQADLCIIGHRNKTEWWENTFSPYWIKQIMHLAPCPVLSFPKNTSQVSK
jgi:nucleotide-binding universal stress UspA family protein